MHPATRPLLAPLIVALAAALLPGCPRKATPDLATPSTYAGHGLRFQYPSNWHLTEDTEEVEGVRVATLTVEGRGPLDSSIAMVQVFAPAPADQSVEELFAQYSLRLREAAQAQGADQIEPGSAETRELALLGAPRSARRRVWTFRILGESARATTDFVAAREGERLVVVVSQADDEDLATAEPAFALIRSTMRLE